MLILTRRTDRAGFDTSPWQSLSMFAADRSVRASRPVRACLSGEDLDWLGGRSVCVALDLETTVTISPESPDGPLPWADGVWSFLRRRLPSLPPTPPPAMSTSEAPTASGLASSTALIMALMDAYLAWLPASVPEATVTRWAYEFEFEICRGGGMDQLSISRGGAVLFAGRTAGLPEILAVAPFPTDWSLIVVDSGKPKSTPGHIAAVRAQRERNDPTLTAYIARTSEISDQVWHAVRAHDLTGLATATTAAHEAMRDLQGMSTPLLEDLRAAGQATTGLSFKLTGAGGGGALVAVCARSEVSAAAATLAAAYESRPTVNVVVADARDLR
jgi:galactokinase